MTEKYGVASPLPRSKYLTNGQKLLNQALGKGGDLGRPQNNSFAGKSFNEESLFSKPKPRKNIAPLLPHSTYCLVTRGSMDSRSPTTGRPTSPETSTPTPGRTTLSYMKAR